MLLAEELLLLGLDDHTGKVVVSELDKGLAGAGLIELALTERVRVAEKGEAGRAGRAVVMPGPAPAPPARAGAGELVAAREGRRPKDVIGKLSQRLRERLADDLVARGVLRREKHKVLGLFPTTRLPALDSGHEAGVRGRIEAALGGATPDERSAALIALLHAIRG